MSSPYEGTGLGLSITKAYAELLGGEIRVDSEKDKCSCFYFTLPYFPADARPSDVVKQPDDETYHWAKKNILVVEDDPTSQLFLREILEPTGQSSSFQRMLKKPFSLPGKHQV